MNDFIPWEEVETSQSYAKLPEPEKEKTRKRWQADFGKEDARRKLTAQPTTVAAPTTTAMDPKEEARAKLIADQENQFKPYQAAKNTGQQMGRGMVGTTQSILRSLDLVDRAEKATEAVATLATGEEKDYNFDAVNPFKAADKGLEKAKEALWPKDNGYVRAKGLKGFGEDLVGGFTQFAPQIALGLASGGTSLSAPLAAGIQQMHGMQYEELVGEVGHERAQTAAIANSVAGGALERIGLKGVFAGWKPTKKTADYFKNFAQGFQAEGITEFLQKYPEYATSLWARTEGESDAERVDKFFAGLLDATKEAAYEGLIGGIVGGTTSTGLAMTSDAMQAVTGKEQQPAENDAFGRATRGFNNEQRAILNEALNAPLEDGSGGFDPEVRQEAASLIYARLAAQDEVLAEAWADAASSAIMHGAPIDVTADVFALQEQALAEEPAGPLGRAAAELTGEQLRKKKFFGTANTFRPLPPDQVADNARGALEWSEQEKAAMLHNQRRNQQGEEDLGYEPELPPSQKERDRARFAPQPTGPLTDQPTSEQRTDALDAAAAEQEWQKQSREATIYNRRKNQQGEEDIGYEPELPVSQKDKDRARFAPQPTEPLTDEMSSEETAKVLEAAASRKTWNAQTLEARLYNQKKNQAQEGDIGYDPEPPGSATRRGQELIDKGNRGEELSKEENSELLTILGGKRTGQAELVDNQKSAAHGQEMTLNPTEAQKEAENYKTVKVNRDGLKLSIENPAGSTRSGTDPSGKQWSQKMHSDYGRILGSVGHDKDHVDAFIAPGYQGGDAEVHIVNQHNKDGSFDEHKVVLGAKDADDAMRLYNQNYEKGWSGGKSVATMPLEEFKAWVKSDKPAKGPVQTTAPIDPELKNMPRSTVKNTITAGRAVKITHRDVRKAFPGTTVRRTKGAYGEVFMVSTPSGGQIIIRPDLDEIRIGNPDEVEKLWQGRKDLDFSQASGAFTRIGRSGIIRLVRGEDAKGTLDHETYHAAESMVLTAREIKQLERKYGNAEARAEAYREHVAAGGKDTILQKILDFAKKIANLMGADLDTSTRTLKNIESGKVWKRQVREEKGPGTTQYAAATDPEVNPRKDGGISTRMPSGVSTVGQATERALNITLPAAKQHRESFDKNVRLVEQYDTYRPSAGANTVNQIANRFISQVKNNLLWIYDQVAPQTRDRSRKWYEGAHQIATRFAKRYNTSTEAVAGVFAALSPQKDWFMNASLGERVLDIYNNHANTPWTEEMSKTAERIFAKEHFQDRLAHVKKEGTIAELYDPIDIAMWIRTYDETYNDRGHRMISPEGHFGDWVKTNSGAKAGTGWGSLNEIGKAVSVLQDQGFVNISKEMGGQHKVRNFFNNIFSPQNSYKDVTIDTHAVAAGLLKPLSGDSTEVAHNFGGVGASTSSETGIGGTYPLYVEAYRQAAKARGVLPREMQSITWEAVRGLFTAGYKAQAANVEAVSEIWKNYREGRIPLHEARRQIISHAGGIGQPAWVGQHDRVDAQIPDSSYLGELDGDQLPGPEVRGSTGRTAGRGAANTPRSKGEGIRSLRALLRGDPRRHLKQSKAFSRKSERVDGVLRLSYTPTPAMESALAAIGADSITYHEIPDARQFRDAMVRSLENNSFAAAVEVKQLKEYQDQNIRLFLTEDGGSGFALKADGDIVSVFKHKGGPRDFLASALSLAIDEGGTKLDAFETVLPELYSRFGFAAAARVKWHDEFKPDTWDFKTFEEYNEGRPDIVMMVYDPENYRRYQPGQGKMHDTDIHHYKWWDAAEKIRNKWVSGKKLKDQRPAMKNPLKKEVRFSSETTPWRRGYGKKGDIYSPIPDSQAPKKTRKVYKLMKVQASRPGVVLPLYAKPESGQAQGFLPGTWYKAETQVPSIGGRKLAPRSGIHAVSLPVFDQGKAKASGESRVWVEVEMPAISEKTQAESDNSPALKNGQREGIRNRLIGIDESYDFKTNPSASVDAGSWPISGSVKVIRVLGDGEVTQILKKANLGHQINNSMTGVTDQGAAEHNRIMAHMAEVGDTRFSGSRQAQSPATSAKLQRELRRILGGKGYTALKRNGTINVINSSQIPGDNRRRTARGQR
jgi:hypothetical protein